MTASGTKKTVQLYTCTNENLAQQQGYVGVAWRQQFYVWQRS